MAKKEKLEADHRSEVEDFTSELIDSINKEFSERIAYNLSEMDAPTIVKRWIDTGSIALNYAIRNAVGGGYPEGRIIEISGLPSCGKSHLAYHAAANVQKIGGLVIYIDSENSTPVQKLQDMGIDVRKRFVFVDQHCTEKVFQVIESTITKAKQVQAIKDVPILVVWDSVAATSPLAELQGEYDQNTMGLQARVISKGLRKITGVIGQNNVTLLCLNQLRDNIGVMHGDPHVSPGGKALPFHSSVRVRLGSGYPVKDKEGNIVGIHVTVAIKKNKVGPPHRKCEFDIIFGKGIVENDYLFDELRKHCKEKGAVICDGKKINISGEGTWKELSVIDVESEKVLITKKFYKSEFTDVMNDPQYHDYVMQAIDVALTINYNLNETTVSNEASDLTDD